MIRYSWDRKPKRFALHAIRWGALIAALLVWQWVGNSSSTSNFFFSKPTAVAARMVNGFVSGSLANDTAATCIEVLLGFILGVGIGAALGLVLWWNITLGRALRPFAVGLASIPIFAVAPMLVFWFGVGLIGKVAVVMLSVLFVCLLSTYQAAEQIETEYWEVAACGRVSRAELFRRAVLKGSLISATPSYQLSILFAFIGAFLAELISSSSGLGHFIARSSGLYDVSGMLAGLTVFVFSALIANRLLEWADNYFAKWR